MTHELDTGKSERALKAEENMALVKEAMETQAQVTLGNKLTHEVPIDFLSSAINPATGKRIRYVGTVVFKKPSTADLMRMGGLKSQYLQLGGATSLDLVDNSIRYLAHVLATLAVVITKRPEWFAKPTDMDDTDIIYHVHDKYVEWESQFRHRFQPTSSDDSEASEGAKALDAT